MAGPQNLHAIPSNLQPVSPANIFSFGDVGPPPQASIAATMSESQTSPAQSGVPEQTPTPAPTTQPDPNPLQPSAVATPSPDQSPEAEHSESDSGEGSDDDEESQPPPSSWRHIEEDKSVPCKDEIEYIESKGEHSALEHAYWETKTFFDLDDPEFSTVASGRIDWLIDPFNGTSNKPNTAELMRSPVIRVGDYDFCIKFFPHGDDTDFLSAYIECVTMQKEDFAEFEDFEAPPFPLLRNMDPYYNSFLKRRRSVAVQFGLVMYNPEEPRVNEYKSEAHQFHKRASDRGFRYFSSDSRYDFHLRKHGQRQTILRNDKLAFSAYIRIVNDPTDCLWQHPGTWNAYDNSVLTTALRPFRHLWPQMPAAAALFHFVPFRDFLRRCKQSTKQVHALQEWLLKFYTRQHSRFHGQTRCSTTSDAVTILREITKELQVECEAAKVTELIGSMDPNRGSAIGHNRLKTKTHGGIQTAIDHHPVALETPELLTVELERQEFDRKNRKWCKITNNVSLDNRIYVDNKKYILFAFGTHIGELESNKHKAYVRPGGSGRLWFAYEDGRVVSMTTKQALETRCGQDERKPEARRDSPFSGYTDLMRDNEVVYVVMYVREDVSDRAFELPKSELWDPPELIKTMQSFPEPRPDKTASTPELNPTNTNFCEPQKEAQSGSATPPWPMMDGDDVIMSDSEDDPTCATALVPEVCLDTITIDALGQDWYQGETLDGERHGKGHLIRMNGNEYKGEFKGGQPHGQGKMVYALTGDVYEGAWQDGEHHGQGDLTEFSTRNTYSGGWKEGRKHGDFVLRGTVTEEDRGCCTICYDREITTAFYDCGHVVACKECANMIENCPVCRKPVAARLQLYGVRMVLS